MTNYIALEGVKGVGKSTVFQLLTAYLQKEKIAFAEACPTKKQANDHSFWELAYSLCQSEFVKERVYAHRSNNVALTTNWNTPLVVGDRSLITSYVSRFWKYQDPTTQIQRVDALEPIIKSPELVLYFKAEIGCIMNRLMQRKNRNYGKEDEVEAKVLADLLAYQTLREKPISDRIKRTKWVDIDCSVCPKDVFEQVLIQLKSIV